MFKHELHLASSAAALALIGISLLAASPASAQDFNVDFSSNLIAPAASFGAAGQPGVWNSINPPGFPASTPVPLVDILGQATGASVRNLSQFSFLGTYDDPLMSGDAKVLMQDGFTVIDIPSRMRFQGLANGDYEIIAYGLLPTNPLSMTSFLGFDGNPTGGVWPGGFQEDFTHVRSRFTVTGGTIDLTWTTPVPQGVGFCNGFQLARVWHDLGQALAGVSGLPVLSGSGQCEAGEPTALTLSSAAPNAPTWLIIGTSQLALPFFGGTLIPSPDTYISNLITNPAGSLQLSFPWPPGGFAGVDFYLQAWILDAAGPAGLAASNGLTCTGG